MTLTWTTFRCIAKSVNKTLVVIAFSEIGPTKFRSENSVLHAIPIDKTAHFGGPKKRKKSFKQQRFFAISGSEIVHGCNDVNLRIHANHAEREIANML